MNNSFIYRVACRTEAGEVAVDAVALQHVTLRHRLAGDLVGHRALDDRPIDAACAGFFLDILKAAIDDGIDVVEFAFDALGAVVAPASVATLATVAAVR